MPQQLSQSYRLSIATQGHYFLQTSKIRVIQAVTWRVSVAQSLIPKAPKLPSAPFSHRLNKRHILCDVFWLFWAILSVLTIAQTSLAQPNTDPNPTSAPASAANAEAASQPTSPSAAKDALPQGFEPPQLIHFVQAPYPEEAWKRKLEGSVILQIVVDQKGAVVSVEVKEPAGHGFDEAALAAARQFRFRPAQYQDKPVPVRISYRYHFFLRKVKRTSPESKPSSDAKSRPSDAKSRPSDAESKPSDAKSRPSDAKSRPSDAKSRPSDAESRPTKSVSQQQPPIGDASHKIRPVAGQRKTGFSQRGFDGYVLERGTRNPIEGAPVYLLGQRFRRYQVTDPDGYFSFPVVPRGRYRLVIPVPNYRRFQQIIDIAKGPRRIQSWYLNRIGAGLFESVTQAKRQHTEVQRKTLQAEEIEILPGTQGDPLKVVQNLPGIARTPLNTGFFIVRGSAPEDSRVYLDGHRIPLLYHFGGLTATINADIAQSIDLIPGGFSVAYGRSMGGIIQVNTREGQARWHGYLDVDLIDVGFFLEGPLWPGATIMISARRSHLDVFLNLILPEIPAFDLTVAPRYYDYQVKLDWKISQRHHLSIMFFGADDWISFLRDVPISRAEFRGEFSFYTNFHRILTRWRFAIHPNLTNDLSIHAGIRVSDAQGGTAIGFADTTWIVTLRDELQWQILPQILTLRTGLDLRLQNVSIALRVPSNIPRFGDAPGTQGADPLKDIIEFSGNTWIAEPAAFLELNWQILASVQAIAGLRFDYYTASDAYTFNPRLNLLWNTPWQPLSIQASVGLFSQPPQFQESSAEFGNPDIKPQHSIHYTTGFNYRWTPYLNTEITFFYKQMFDLIVRSDKTVMRDGKEVSERLHNAGTGQAYGVEFMLRHRPHRQFFGWISYTLSRSERQNAPDQDPILFNFDQTHILTVLGAYKIGWGLTASARFRLVSGNPTTPLRGGIYDADAGRYIPIPGIQYSTRNPLFHQLDLRVDYELTFNTWKLMFYLDVQNVYNYANQEGTINNYDYSQQAPLTGVPIFPSFGIKGQF
jgi:TonB family protein